MRLINAKTGELKEFDEDDRPPYAILSHTWGTREDEVSFQEAEKYQQMDDSHPCSLEITRKPGYKKIQGCCQQALRDGIDWVWVDTCCIDKTSSTELSEAINSMFRWYRQSLVCYVHLSDVMDGTEDFSTKKSAFRHSRWFTRGWTLQELLAPHKVQFFARDWGHIGEMTEGSGLVDVVSEITSIPPGFLERQDLGLASVAAKMSWAATRNTTRTEDTAYSLLGIFDINMPLVYGEGKKAFRRLQEEIIKQTFDHTLFAWGTLAWREGYSESAMGTVPILADSPADFLECGGLVHQRPQDKEKSGTSYQITNQGLEIELPLAKIASGEWLAKLSCSHWEHPDSNLAISLKERGGRLIRTSTLLFIDDHLRIGVGDTYQKERIVVHSRTNKSEIPECTIIVDFPPEYHYEVQYMGPSFKVKKNRLGLSSNSLQISYPQGLEFTNRNQWNRVRLPSLGRRIRGALARGSLPMLRLFADSTCVQLQLIRDQHAHHCAQSFLLSLCQTPEHSFEFYLHHMPQCNPGEGPTSCTISLNNPISLNSFRAKDAVLDMKVLRRWTSETDILVKIEDKSETTSLDFTTRQTQLLNRIRLLQILNITHSALLLGVAALGVEVSELLDMEWQPVLISILLFQTWRRRRLRGKLWEVLEGMAISWDIAVIIIVSMIFYWGT